MAETPLRAYIRDIDSMIDRGDLEDAIIHCRHILSIYPKHIDTYRLLGKAFLEAQRYSDAADVFQRVLSSVPDDYISHIGMSLIREDEANIEAAIYHMERAAEVQPANQAIQAEQRRLYGRRDRVEPSRVGLTRGALARMYYNGELYSQAITELRAALAEEPQRSDLRLLLANTYYKSGCEVDAADACSSILSKLPYCFEANLLLAEILSHTKRAEESKIYSQRAYELDPYAEYITENTSSSTMVPESSVMVEHLDDESEQDQELSQADWMTSIGLQDDDLKQKPSPTPEWLLDESSDQLPDNGDLEPSKDHIPPFTFLEDDEDVEPAKMVPPTDYGDVTPEISDNDKMMDQNQDTDELLPDWLKDAGWHSTVDGDDARKIEATTELETTALPEISEADIPDWLQALAPPEDVEADQQTETQLTKGEIGEAAARSWLDDTPTAATEGDTDWLGMKADTESDLDTALSQDEIEAPEWLKNLTPSSDMSKEEIPDWLVDLEEAISEGTDTVKEAITENFEKSASEDSSAADEISDAPSAESIIDDAIMVTAVGIAAAEQLSQPEPEDDPEGLLTSDQDPLATPQEGDYQAYAEDAPEIHALELSEQLEEEISEQPVAAQDSGDEIIPIDNGEDLPQQEGRVEIEPVETVVGPLQGIVEDAPIEELLEQSSDEVLKLDAEETVESYPDSYIEKTEIQEEPEGFEKTEPRDAEPYTWLEESALPVPDSDGPDVAREETHETVSSQPELQNAVEAEVAMNENIHTDKPDNLDDAADSERVDIPDWLDDFDSVPIQESPIENEPEEIPDWLRSLAPQEAESVDAGGGELVEESDAIESYSTEPIDTESDDFAESVSSEDLLPDWLSAEAPEYAPAQIASEPILDWLDSMGDDDAITDHPAVEAEDAADVLTPTLDVEEPPILVDDTKPSILDAPEESDDFKLETKITSAEADIEEDISDQVDEFPIAADLEVDEEADIIPDWLSEIASVSPQEEEIRADDSDPDIPDWLRGLAEDSESSDEIQPGESATAEIEAKEEAGTEDAIPDWVQELAPREPGVIEDPDEFIEPSAEVEPIVVSTESLVSKADTLAPDKDDSEEEFQTIDTAEIEEPIVEEQPEPAPRLEEEPSEPIPVVDTKAYETEQTAPFTDADTEELVDQTEAEEQEIPIGPDLMVIETATLNATITPIEHADESQEEEIAADLSTVTDDISVPTSEAEAVHEGEIDSERIEDKKDARGDISETEPELPDWLTGVEESRDVEEEAVWQPSQVSDVREGELDISETEVAPEISEELTAADLGDIEDELQIALVQARNALVQGDQDNAISQYNNLIESKQFLPEVINDLQGALTQSPTDMTLWQTLGDAYASADRLQDALDAYTKAEQLLG